MTFVIHVGKKEALVTSLPCKVTGNRPLLLIRHPKQAKEIVLRLILLMNKILQISLISISRNSSRTRRWRIDYLITDGTIHTN